MTTPAPGEEGKGGTTFEINPRCLGQRTPVIMYHDIVKGRGRGSVWFDCTKDEFQDQLKTIQRRGYQPVSLDQLHTHLTEGTPLPDRAVVLTFDDNYEGFYDNALPLLKKFKYPAAMFVHTKFVGDKSGSHPKMDWAQLKEIAAEPLITIGSHTVTHPDLPKLTPDLQRKELTDSKAELESQLGKKVDYFAYPDGKYDDVSKSLAKEAGYLMSFSIDNGPVEESPTIEVLNRTINTRLTRALDECDRDRKLVSVTRIDIKGAPVTYKEVDAGGLKLAMVSGGLPITVTSMTREGVLDFMHRTSGTVAGINGTFFAMAAIQATDNRLVGPCKTATDKELIPDKETARWPKLKNRPMVVIGPTQLVLLPFNPWVLNSDDTMKQVLPDYTDAFLGGVWLVHQGVAFKRDDLTLFGSKDIEDPRRRAAFGITADGHPVEAASKDSVSSSQFARMLAGAGVQEAVLLDSGFSTSLVYGEKIMASGHSTPTTPSRPVPHAILLKGTLDPASQTAAEAAVPATQPDAGPTRHRRRRRHRRTETAAPAPAPDDAGAPPSPPSEP